jgi:hypothetical protein
LRAVREIEPAPAAADALGNAHLGERPGKVDAAAAQAQGALRVELELHLLPVGGLAVEIDRLHEG